MNEIDTKCKSVPHIFNRNLDDSKRNKLLSNLKTKKRIAMRRKDSTLFALYLYLRQVCRRKFCLDEI